MLAVSEIRHYAPHQNAILYTAKCLWDVTNSSFQQLSHAFSEIRLVQWWKKYEPQVLVLKSTSLVLTCRKLILQLFAKTGHWPGQCRPNHWMVKIQQHELFAKSLTAVKILSGAYIPFAIYKIAKYSIAFFKGNDKIDTGLSLVNEFSSLIDGTISLAKGMSSLGFFAERLLFWTTPLAIFSTVLAASSIISYSRRIWQLSLFYKEMKKNEDKDGCQTLILWFFEKNEKELGAIFKCNGSVLKQKLEDIFCGQGNHLDTAQELKNRITKRITCEKLSLISSSISIIGVGVLFFAGANPLAYVLMTASAGLYTAKYFIDKVSIKRFDRFLNAPSQMEELIYSPRSSF